MREKYANTYINGRDEERRVQNTNTKKETRKEVKKKGEEGGARKDLNSIMMDRF